MIRLATVLVLFLAAFLAVGAFFLGRGDGRGPETAPIAATPPPAEPETIPEPEPERVFFLRDIDLGQGPVAVILRDAITDSGDLVVIDQAAIQAAQDVVFVDETVSGGDVIGMIALAVLGVETNETAVNIYQNDVLIAELACLSTSCGSFAKNRDLDLAGLLEAAQPLIAAQTYHESYDDYLATIETIRASADYMFLDGRSDGTFPLDRQIARMDIALPTLIVPAGTSINPDEIVEQIAADIEPMLPDGARMDGVRLSARGAGIVVDRDRGTPVLAGGARILFPEVEFHTVTVPIQGASHLDQSHLDRLTARALYRTDYSDAFATFVRDRLQNTCIDCFDVQMNGDFYDAATIISSTPEGYVLDYYDLREAP